jgi:cytidine deaminase
MTGSSRPIGSNDTTIDELLEVARQMQLRAYAPYSQFRVGAALRTDSGLVFGGCNVENAAYPQGLCAEAGAIAAMVAAGERRITALLTVSDGDPVATCCGGCRQKIREFADQDVAIHAAAPDGVRASFTLAKLLPASFGPEHLGRPDPRTSGEGRR